MSNEIQLIVNGVLLPTTTRDRYSCYPDELKEQITMISGRMVEEVRGTVPGGPGGAAEPWNEDRGISAGRR